MLSNCIPPACRGFDDRGMIYVKLGKPSGTASAGVSGRDIRSNYSFKPNEVWFYNFIDPQLYFPFVHLQDRRGYVLVDGIEEAVSGSLVANKWRSFPPRGSATDSLGRQNAVGLISDTPEIDTRIYFYKQLAIVSPVFYERVNELETLLLQKQYAQSPLPASYYSQIAVTHMNSIDYRDDSFHEQVTPVDVSTTLPTRPLPLVYRTARFLEPDGSTRIEIYLGLRNRDLVLKEESHQKPQMLKMSAIVEDRSLWPASEPQTAIILLSSPHPNSDSSTTENGVVIQELSVNTRLDTFFVSGEVGQWRTSVTAQPAQLALSDASAESYIYLNSEKLLQSASFRIPPLTALHLEADGQHIMSDVQLSRQIVPTESRQAASKGGLAIEPYPFHLVERRYPLFLYFEIYGLTLNAENTTHYRVAYEMEQINEKKTIWTRVKSLLGRKQSGLVELESDYIGTSSNVSEWISLDFSELAPGAVRLNVTVTDQHSGKVSKRAVNFELI